MTDPTASLLEERTRWLIQTLSVSTREDALAWIASAWRRFTNCQSVLVYALQSTGARGVFLDGEQPPKDLPRLTVVSDSFCDNPQPADLFNQLQLPTKSPSDDEASLIRFDFDAKFLGCVCLNPNLNENALTELEWLQEASSRILANFSSIEARLRAEKLESLGEFAAGAGHEINNPVATIAGRAQGLLQSEADPERRRQLRTIGGQALRIRDMIGDTMLFARPPTPAPEWLDLQDVLPEILAPLQADFENAGATFTSAIEDSVPIFADRVQLAVVITELLRNSREWLRENGKVDLNVSAIETKTGSAARIVIEDNGETFLEEHRPHLFDPFFSGRQAGRGLGFGLPKCWRIVSNHGGTIEVTSLGNDGTRATVIWPAYDFRETDA